ncbi:hypothetical protein [Nocardioides sp.]|uniref:hypothetical protein n=1 Tax=Nocardioides sp. TaxID=35761 RepID=UPI00261050FE|nr:hypothetical protein [Nocardioides sp.]MDI6910148.1 hypothetical protein [Nocardioides sp.]
MGHRWDPIAPPVTGLVRPVHVDPTGRRGPTRGQARGAKWRSVGPGLVVPAHVADDLVEQRILEAASRAGPRSVVTAWAALRLHGGGFFDGLARDGRTRLPVPIAANGERLGSDDAILVVRLTVPPDEVVEIHGIRCAVPERALFDEMRRIGGAREMAVAAGAACAGQLTSLHRMALYRSTRRWYRDVRVVGRALDMAVEDCRSPQEDRFRMIWEYDAGWGRPLRNHPVLDLDGRLVAVPDLLDPVRGVVGEYAGADHRDIDQHESDIAREAALRAVGLEYVEVVGRDLYRADRVTQRMREAQSRARQLPCLWQLGPPPSPTLDEILDARDRSSDARWLDPGSDPNQITSLDGR